MCEIKGGPSRHMYRSFRRYNLIQRNVADATKITCVRITYLIELQKYIFFLYFSRSDSLLIRVIAEKALLLSPRLPVYSLIG